MVTQSICTHEDCGSYAFSRETNQTTIILESNMTCALTHTFKNVEIYLFKMLLTSSTPCTLR